MSVIGRLLSAFRLDATIKPYVPVGLDAGEVEVSVTLERRGSIQDVSRLCVIASLNPLRISIAGLADSSEGKADLWFRESGGLMLGRLGLKPVGFCGPRESYRLYEIAGSDNLCLRKAELGINYLRYEVDRLRRRKERFAIGGQALRALLVFYSRPRVVVIVSVGADDTVNLFPMDLLGVSEEGAMLMALRSTNPSIAIMRRTRRIAMSEVPPAFKEHAYALASGHKQLRLAGEPLPFAVAPSPTWRLPLPAEAMGVREVEVVHVDEIGSHCLFTTKIVHESMRPGRRLHHLSGFYARSLRVRGRAIEAR